MSYTIMELFLWQMQGDFFTNDCIERAFCFGEYEYFKMVIDMDFI